MAGQTTYIAKTLDDKVFEVLEEARSSEDAVQRISRWETEEQKPELRVMQVSSLRFTPQQRVQFVVGAVSGNRNALGLRGHVLLDRDGHAYEVGLNYLNCKAVGDIVALAVCTENDHDRIASALSLALGGEIPRYMGKAPAEVVKEAWRGL